MTILENIDENGLKELLIKNLPSKLKGGNVKEYSNVDEHNTIYALDNCKFINFNSKEQISFMVFDMDKYKNKTALEYFKDIDSFLYYVVEIVGYEPTYICETNKGFQFGYHLKNHIFTYQKKAVAYLKVITETITEKAKLDANASNRLIGVYRNPLIHKYYFSEQLNYELNDFKYLLPKKTYHKKNYSKGRLFINKNLDIGDRNKGLFYNGMRYAKNKIELEVSEVSDFLNEINLSLENPLSQKEVFKISNSIYGYWKKNKISENFGKVREKKDINEGVMNLPKISGLSKSEFKKEVKKRRELSAQRTNEIRDKEKNKEQLKKVREEYISKKYDEYEKKINEAVKYFKENDIKVNILKISKYTGIDRRSVKKVFKR